MKIKSALILFIILSASLLFAACGGTPEESETRGSSDTVQTETEAETSGSSVSTESESATETACSHDFEVVSGVAPTCTAEGYAEYRVCRLCGHKDGYTVLAPTHDYTTVPEKPATETEDGYTEHQLCTRCGHKNGFAELAATHTHALTEHPDGETNPLFYRCRCGFSVVSDLRTRPMIAKLSDAQYEQFVKIYNMMKNKEPSCQLNISAKEAELFRVILQGDCPELFLVEYENSSLAIVPHAAVWNPDCMTSEDYNKTCAVLIDTMLQWEKDCRSLEDVDKIAYLVDWMAENTVYSSIGTTVRSLYGAIIERELNCVGYAQILSWALNLFDIPCMSVNGSVDEGHMWNLVQLDGEWYQLDGGWSMTSSCGTPYANYVYVNVTDRELDIGKSRVYLDAYAQCGIQIPECTATTQNFARRNGYYVTSADSITSKFESAVVSTCAEGRDIFTLVCENKATQNAVLSYVEGSAESALKKHGINIFWYASGHDPRTNLYFVFLHLARPNLDEVSIVADQKPAAGVGYKLALRQNQNGQVLFFSGKTTEKYLATTADPTRATDVFYKEVDGGFRLWFMDGYLKKYVDIIVGEDGSAQATVSLSPSAVYRIDEATGAIVATVNGVPHWLGTYNQFSTIGASKISYISGNNASKLGVSQYPAALVTVKGITPTKMQEPPVPEGKGTAYKLVIEQNNLGKTLYLQGWRTRNFPATTINKNSSPNVYVEQVEGGYQLYYLWGENKMYLNAQGFGANQVSLQLKTRPGVPFNYDEKLGIYTVTMYDNVYYMGTYSSYDNISLSNISYISGDNAAKIGISQFPAYLKPVK